MQCYETLDEQSLRAEQHRLEQESDTEAVAQLLRTREQELGEGKVTYNPQVHSLMRAALPKVKAVLQHHTESRGGGPHARFRRVLRAVDIDILSAATLVAVFTHYFTMVSKDKPITFQGLSRFVGHAIVVEMLVAQASTVNPLYMASVKSDLDRRGTTHPDHLRKVYRDAYNKVMPADMSVNFTPTEYIHIGKFGVDACYESGLLVLNRSYNKGKTLVTYRLNPEIEEYIYTMGGESALGRIVSSTYRRMICKPDRWVSPYGGGYLSTRRKSQCGLIVHRQQSPSSIKRYRSELEQADLTKIYTCANYLQEIPYTIHTPTKELIQKVWETGGGIFDIPSREQCPKPPFPFDKSWNSKDATHEELQQHRLWKRKAREWYEYNHKLKSKQREIWGFLRHTDSGHERLYFPVFMDRRGRWYYRAYPNPQGSDISRAVLHFHNRKPLGKDGLYWLKVHLANLLGYDDVRFNARVAYIDKHLEDIMRATDNPIDNHEVFGTDSPMSAFSAAYELTRAIRSGNPEAYCTGIPVHMDATVSGTQHFSALLRDPIGAKYSNLIDSGGPSKADLYSAVAEAALDSIKADLANGVSVDHAKFWVDLGVPRDLAKRPVMVYTYNVTLFSVCNYIQDWLDEAHPDKSLRVKNATLRYLGEKLFESLAKIIPATAIGMKYLTAVGAEVGSQKPLAWITPKTGMLVYHEYTKSRDKRVKVNSAGIVFTTVRESLDEVRPASMTSALAPNFIHSLDAAHLTMVALEMQERGHDFVGIHDSFGTHACDVGEMHKVIREKFVELYNEPILEDFKAAVGSEIELPTQGNLKLERVIDSEFMFC